MENTKRSLMGWVIIICWIVTFALIFLKCFVLKNDTMPISLLFLGCQLIFFAKSMFNLALINQALYELKYDNIFYRKIHLPPFMRKFCYGYSDIFGVYSTVLVMQIIEFVALLCGFTYAGLSVYGYLTETTLFSQDFYIEIILLLIICCPHFLITGCLIYLTVKLEKNERSTKHRSSMSFRETKHIIKEIEWRNELNKRLKKACQKYKNKDCLLKADIPEIEQKILNHYIKHINYSIDIDDKNKSLLTIRSKYDGMVVFQIPIKK